jgi:hypothetical protein
MPTQVWVDMGSLDAVKIRSHEVLLYNLVIADRRGKIDRVCWAGNPVNVGVTANPFKMDSLQSVSRLLQQEDWMLNFDLKEGFIQIP